MINGALNKYLQTPAGQTLAQKVDLFLFYENPESMF